MEDVANTHRECESEHCRTHSSNPAYRGYCMRCFIHLFPDENISRHYKIKETHFTDYIKTLVGTVIPAHLQIAFDRRIDGGCSLRRPDVFIDALTHGIILEFDENGHNTDEYCSCESKRLMQLFQDLGSRPLVCIRINPDAYTDKDGKRVQSCFKRHKTLGVPMIRSKADWAARLAVVTQRIAHHIGNVPSQEVVQEHLYFDGFV